MPPLLDPPPASPTPPAGAAPRYAFGPCLLDLGRRELRVSGRAVPLQPRGFDLLAHLVACHGQALTKESLIAAVWPTTAVTDAVLTTAVAKVRRAIGDTDEATPMLRTLHGLGYRFDAAVQRLDSPPAAPEATDAGPPLAAMRAAMQAAVPAGPGADAVPEPAPAPALAPEGIAARLTRAEGLSETDFWRQQAQRAVALEAIGQSEAALALLEPVLPRLPVDDELALLHARLLRHRIRTDEAAAVLQRTLAQGADTRAPRLQAALLVEAAWLRDLCKDLNGALTAIDQAVTLLTPSADDAPVLADALAVQAMLLYRSGGYAASLRLTQRVEQLTADGACPGARALALTVRSRCASRDGDLEGAFAVAIQSLQLAQSAGLYHHQVDAYVRLAYLCELSWRFDLQECFGRRGAEIATDQGDLTRRDRSRTHLLYGLVYAGRLAQAEALLDQYEQAPRAAENWHSRHNFGIVRAELDWRAGRLREGLDRLRPLIDSPHAIGMADDAASRYSLWAMALGDATPARAGLARAAERHVPQQQPVLEAAVALHDGDRARAKRTLQAAWASQPANLAGVWTAMASLAWMLLEDREQDRLPGLMQAVNTLPTTHASVPLLLHLHEIRRGARAFEPQHWDALVRANPGLVHRHAWLLQPAEVQRLLAGEGRRLSELYLHACF